MMSDLLFRRWCREHQSSMRYRHFRVLKSTIFVISTLWTDLVAGVAALEAYRLYMILRRQAFHVCDRDHRKSPTKARRHSKARLHTARACYTNALCRVSSSAAPSRTCADWTGAVRHCWSLRGREGVLSYIKSYLITHKDLFIT